MVMMMMMMTMISQRDQQVERRRGPSEVAAWSAALYSQAAWWNDLGVSHVFH